MFDIKLTVILNNGFYENIHNVDFYSIIYTKKNKKMDFLFLSIHLSNWKQCNLDYILRF